MHKEWVEDFRNGDQYKQESGFVQGRGDTKGVGRGLWTPRFNSWVGNANKGVEGAAVEGGGEAASIDCSWRMWEDHIGPNALSG